MEEQSSYSKEEHHVPNYEEKAQSQLPALQLLIRLGWQYLTPEETVVLRGGRVGSAILEPLLADHLRKQRYEFKGSHHPFTENAIQNAVQALKGFRATGASHQNEEVYDLLCLGTSIPQTVEGDTKSFPVNYINWKAREKNSLHSTAEFKVERIGRQSHYVPDIVLFVNGIPVVVIECKRSAYIRARKEPVDLAISQLGEYQQKEGIPQLFLSSQILLALARDKAEYGTTGTELEFWSVWQEEGVDKAIKPLISKPLSVKESNHLLSGTFSAVKNDFIALMKEGRGVYEQDRALYSLCRPDIFFDLIHKFIVYDNGIKKIARYQQHYTVRDIMKRLLSSSKDAREGGVVWHTQGSGKTLTMVMLAKCLALHDELKNPKIILVTDRIDLDDQICGTFRACGLEPEKAGTGKHLLSLLYDDHSHIVTTVINKFMTALSGKEQGRVDKNTFVLVDEGHRTQYSEQHARMRIALKGACFIAFTGTPLAKSAKKNTFAQFGKLYKPPYTITRAEKDKAVRPLLYEARHVPQNVNKKALDGWFEKLTLSLNKDQKADLKRKFSTKRQLNKAEQKVRMVAWDINCHYSTTYQGTALKGQLVTPNKDTALQYKQFFEEFAQVSVQVLISAPSVREGVERDTGPSAREKKFWQEMMDRYGSEKKYNKQLINAFKKGDTPEIIIVVDKLLTGFDAPCNAVLYLARHMREHSLLQAITRVNRIHIEKEYGLVLDYSGVIEELDEAIEFYDKLADYDSGDLENTVTYISDKVNQLPQLHSDLWKMFPELQGKKDTEAYQIHLRDNALRDQFYERFSLFARTLSLALSSIAFLEKTPLKTIDLYKKDLKNFQNLRADVAQRYQEVIQFREYEPRIKKLMDTHVEAADVVQLCEPINLLNPGEREKILADKKKSPGAKADIIASATSHVISQEMSKDPAFYRKFSIQLKEVIKEYYDGRLKSLEALEKLEDISTKVVTHTDDNIPSELAGKDIARRYYGCVKEELHEYKESKDIWDAEISLKIVERIKKHKIRDWRVNPDALKKMGGEIDDILFDVLEEHGLELPVATHDAIIEKCIEIAIANEDE